MTPRRQPTRLPRPWDSPSKNPGVRCHFLLQCRKVKSGSDVAQSCPTLSDPMGRSLPGSSIHEIFQSRVLEWGAIVFSKHLQRTYYMLLLLLLLSHFSRVHRWPLTRLPRPWDSPGKNTGVRCHFLLQCIKVKSESQVAQSCLTLSNSLDCSLPGSSIHGIFQARVLEWGAIAF